MGKLELHGEVVVSSNEKLIDIDLAAHSNIITLTLSSKKLVGGSAINGSDVDDHFKRVHDSQAQD